MITKALQRKGIPSPVYLVMLSIHVSLIVFALFIESRALTLGFSISLLFILGHFNAVSVTKRNAVYPILLSLFILCVLVFLFKQDSSRGRMLIYKISFQIFKDNPISGIGVGKFGYIYKEYQSDYFARGNYSIKELLLADNTRYAFNDYWQFVTETGITGLFVIIFLMIFVFRVGFQAFALYKSKPVGLLLATCTIISLSVAAAFTHLFDIFFYQVLIIGAIVLLCFYAKWLSLAKAFIVFFLLFISLAWCSFNNYLSRYYYYKQYEEAETLYKAGYKTEALSEYQMVYPALNEDRNFLSGYCSLLSDLNYNTEAEAVAEKLIKLDNTSVYYLKLGDCYYKNKKYSLAEKAYVKAVNMVPNRFQSRYKLFLFYNEQSQMQNAYAVGKVIITMPVKVNSILVQRIKESVIKLLQK